MFTVPPDNGEGTIIRLLQKPPCGIHTHEYVCAGVEVLGSTDLSLHGVLLGVWHSPASRREGQVWVREPHRVGGEWCRTGVPQRSGRGLL